MEKTKEMKIRPYARLLTMLGEQLIKNERIALIELIKNSYDADATWVKVTFSNFKDNYGLTKDSEIIIEDNGHGMDIDVIEKHLLNPATPEKKRRKDIKNTTVKGRVIQGEKGIGRFAFMKLGRKIEITTRKKGQNLEHVVDFDFRKFDDEFLTENGKNKELFIDDITVDVRGQSPRVITEMPMLLGAKKVQRDSHGTQIRISGLKGSWSEQKVKNINHDLARLETIFDSSNLVKKDDLFEVYIYKGSEPQRYHEQYLEKLQSLLTDRAVIRIEDGVYDEKKGEYKFTLNGVPKVLSLRSPDVTALRVFKDRFGVGGKELEQRKTDCGSFRFGFFVFDLTPQAPAKYQMDSEEKDIVRDHRIYLYRDGIRVYPYGEPDDDWLKIDMYRGTISAGHFLSNDQVVGFVNITQESNPKLKDKTSREGLIEEGNATDDFIVLLQTILAYVRQKPYAQYREQLKEKNAQDIFKSEQIQQDIENLKEVVDDNRKALNLIAKVEKEYRAERKYLVQRAETTEELAGVGLSVETASHDIMAIMSKAMTSIDALIVEGLGNASLDREELQKELQSLRGMLSFVEAQLKDIRLLFKSSKQRRRAIKVKEILDKVERIYRRLLKKEGIDLSVNETGSPLIAKTTDAVLLQLLLNLFDNAVYWLQQTAQKQKKIEISLDGHQGKLIFSDNGPGVSKDDAPYIFEPFYSGKGEEGRGLGLYIARQLLERNDYSIELGDRKADMILRGANFVVSFVAKENPNE